MGPREQGVHGAPDDAPKCTLIAAGSVEECAQPAAAARVTEFAKRFCFDLPYALASDGEVLADFFERMLGAVFQSESHFDDALLTRSQRIQHLLCHFLQIDID